VSEGEAANLGWVTAHLAREAEGEGRFTPTAALGHYYFGNLLGIRDLHFGLLARCYAHTQRVVPIKRN
jgi:hypothetical protein